MHCEAVTADVGLRCCTPSRLRQCTCSGNSACLQLAGLAVTYRAQYCTLGLTCLVNVQIITFDEGGVYGHKNHKACFDAVR